MIQEAMKYLQEEGRAAVADNGKVEALADDQFLVLAPGGGHELITAPPRPVNNVASSIDGLAEQVLHYSKRGKVVVFVGNDAATAVLNEDDDRRGCVTMHLVLSEQMDVLKAGLKDMDQRVFIRALRHFFHDSMVDEGILPMLRQLKFSKNEDGESSVQTGRESLGLSVQKRVSGLDMDKPLPEDIGLNVPVYRNLRRATTGGPDFFRASVLCTFDVDVDRGRFSMTPKPGELERAVEEANLAVTKEIREALTAKGLDLSDEQMPKVIEASAYRA